jgi:hypothetical protein
MSKPSSEDSSQLPSSKLRRHLPQFLQREAEIVKMVRPLLEAHEEELVLHRQLDPEVALVEVLWTPAHQEKEISTSEVTKRRNALLCSRGECLTHNAWQVGWTLARLGLRRRDNGHNRVLRFSREMRRQIHQLAARFGLKLPKVAGCADCAAA